MKTLARVLFWEGLVLLSFAALTLFFFSFQTAYELLFPIVFGGMGLLGVAVGLAISVVAWARKKDERAAGGETAFGQTTKFGVNAVIYTLIFFGILVFVNLLVAGHAKSFDLTSAKVNTLSDQTTTVLQNIPQDSRVEIVGFFKSGEDKPFLSVAQKYADISKQVVVRSIDPDLHPEEVSRYAISERGAVAVTCDTPDMDPTAAAAANRCTGQTNITMDPTESGITAAIVKVTAPRVGAIYFLEGHGEVPLDGEDERGYALIKKGLVNENLDLQPLLLLTAGSIPANAALIVIAGPTRRFEPEEIKLLETYLMQGGRLMVMLDPQTETGLEPLLAAYGVTPRNDIIVDRQVRLFQGSVLGLDPVVVDYPHHEITEKFGQNPTLFHTARSLDTTMAPILAGAIVDPLLNTGPDSWGETDLSFLTKENAEPEPDAVDASGPLTLGVAVERPVGEGEQRGTTRLVVIGDSDFAANRYVAQGFNADLFFNAINWLTGQESYISVRPNTFAPDVFTMTEKDTALIFFASVFLIPQIVVMLGIGVALRRRS